MFVQVYLRQYVKQKWEEGSTLNTLEREEFK